MLALVGLFVSSCASYTAVTRVGKGQVAVVKNDGFFYGLFRGPQVYVCTATKSGLKDCATQDNP